MSPARFNRWGGQSCCEDCLNTDTDKSPVGRKGAGATSIQNSPIRKSPRQ